MASRAAAARTWGAGGNFVLNGSRVCSYNKNLILDWKGHG